MLTCGVSVWFPPDVLEAMGYDPEQIAQQTPPWTHTRYCLKCDVRFKGQKDEVCWYCGGEAQGFPPKGWPSGGSGETVYDGKSYSAWEIDVPESIVALLLEGFQTGDMGDDAVVPTSVLGKEGQ